MKSAWFTTWSAAPGEPEHDERGLAAGPPEEREPRPERDDPDVLDGVVREQPLQVVLRERERDAEHGGGAPDTRSVTPHHAGGASKRPLTRRSP